MKVLLLVFLTFKWTKNTCGLHQHVFESNDYLSGELYWIKQLMFQSFTFSLHTFRVGLVKLAYSVCNINKVILQINLYAHKKNTGLKKRMLLTFYVKTLHFLLMKSQVGNPFLKLMVITISQKTWTWNDFY